MEHQKHSAVMKWSLIIAIVIVMNLFFNYAISLVYKAPDYTAYFSQTQIVPDIATQQDCISVGGQWNMQMPQPAPVKTGPQQNGYCNPDFTKQQQFDAAQKQYDRTVFIILVVVGVLSIIIGSIVVNEILSSAFSWGGVLSLLIASMRYWSDANNLLKVCILAMALGALIWTAVKKFSA